MAHRQMSLQGAQRSVMQLDAYSRHKKFVNGASEPAALGAASGPQPLMHCDAAAMRLCPALPRLCPDSAL